MKELLKKLARRLGYEVHRLPAAAHDTRGEACLDPPGHPGRPVGQLKPFLEDLRARGFAPRAVLDGGAHQGWWSRTVKAVFPHADCYLLEPQHEMKPYLEEFCREYPGSRYFLAGAGAQPGERVLTVWHADATGASLLPEASEEMKAFADQRRVPIVTIDALIETQGVPVPDLVKLDIQGFELEALRGGERLFGRTELFILELSLFRYFPGWPLFHEMVAFMAGRGYYVYDFPDIFWRRPPDGALGAVDVCFAKRDGVLRQAEEA